MSKNLLPAGLVPPSRTAEYDALIGKSLEQEGTLLDKRVATLKTGVKKQEGITSQAHIRELQNVDTGNPLNDKKIRDLLNKNRSVGLYDDKMINDSMEALDKAGSAEYLTNVAVTDKLRSEDHRKIGIEQQRDIGQYEVGSPKWNAAIEGYVDDNIANSRNIPGVTALATQAFEGANIVLGATTVSDAIRQTGGDPNDPQAYIGEAYELAIKNATNNLAKNNRGIRNRSVLRARAKKLIDNSPEGRKFSLRMKAREGQDVHDAFLEKEALTLTTSLNIPDRGKSRAATDASINRILSYINANPDAYAKIKPFEEDIFLALERTDLIKDSGKGMQPNDLFESMFKEIDLDGNSLPVSARGPIELREQTLFKNKLREIYQDKYRTIPDKLLNAQIDKVINSSRGLSKGFEQGMKAADFESRREDKYMELAENFRTNQETTLFGMKTDGKKGYILKRLDKVLKELSFSEDEGTAKYFTNIKNKVGESASDLIDRYKAIFTDRNGKYLIEKGSDKEAAFWLTLNRAIVGHTGIDEDTGLPFDDNDVVIRSIDRHKEMKNLSDFQLMKLFRENMPPDELSSEGSKRIDYNVQNGVTLLEKLAGERNDAVANQAMSIKETGVYFFTGIIPERFRGKNQIIFGKPPTKEQQEQMRKNGQSWIVQKIKGFFGKPAGK